MNTPSNGAPLNVSCLSPCDQVAVYENALFQLASGKNRIQVRYGEQWVQYGVGSTAYLERALSRARALCDRRRPISIGWNSGGHCQ